MESTEGLRRAKRDRRSIDSRFPEYWHKGRAEGAGHRVKRVKVDEEARGTAPPADLRTLVRAATVRTLWCDRAEEHKKGTA